MRGIPSNSPCHKPSPIPELGIGLGLWQGEFEGIPRIWLRWYDAQGNWMPTDTERERTQKEQALEQIEQERTQKEQALQQVEQERAQKEQALEQLLQVARNLLKSGMPIAQISQCTGLPETELRKLEEL